MQQLLFWRLCCAVVPCCCKLGHGSCHGGPQAEGPGSSCEEGLQARLRGAGGSGTGEGDNRGARLKGMNQYKQLLQLTVKAGS